MFSEAELDDVLFQAKTAISRQCCFFWIDSNALIEEFIHLKVDHIEELWPLVLELLQEITPQNYVSTPSEIAENTIFKFAWKSRKMKKKMEIQFSTKKGVFYYLSLCSERPKKCF